MYAGKVEAARTEWRALPDAREAARQHRPTKGEKALTGNAKELRVENPLKKTFRNQDSQKLGRRKISAMTRLPSNMRLLVALKESVAFIHSTILETS